MTAEGLPRRDGKGGDGNAVAAYRGRFTLAQIAEALVKAGGINAEAARILAAASGKPCQPDAIRHAVYRHPELQKVVEQTKEVNLDIAEAALMQRIKLGDTNAIRFYLETQGRRRGYSRKWEIEGTITHVQGPSIDDAKAELLRRYERIAAAKEIEGEAKVIDGSAIASSVH